MDIQNDFFPHKLWVFYNVSGIIAFRYCYTELIHLSSLSFLAFIYKEKKSEEDLQFLIMKRVVETCIHLCK